MTALEYIRSELSRRHDRMTVYQDFLSQRDLVEWVRELLTESESIQDEVDEAEWAKDRTEELERERDELETERDKLQEERDELERERDELKEQISKGQTSNRPDEKQSPWNGPVRLVCKNGLLFSKEKSQ